MVWNPKFHYPVHKIPVFVSVLSQMNQVHSFPFKILKIHFNL